MKIKVLALMLITLVLVVASNINTRTATVVQSYYSNNTVVLVTEDGNVWELERRNNLRNPQTIKFDTKGTKDVTDDTIMEVYE